MFINDPTGAGLNGIVHIQSIGSGFDKTLITADGRLALHTLPLGVYTIDAKSPRFVPANVESL